MVSGTLSLRSSRCLSSFSRLTDSLSVVEEYLALEGGPPMFNPGSTSPSLLEGLDQASVTGLSPAVAHLSRCFTRRLIHPRSLAATDGIAVAFFSCAYLDVSVLHVRSTTPIHSGLGIPKGMGCPIRTSTDRSLFTSSLWLFAGYRVLLRLSTPRHPPCALMAWSHQPDAAIPLRVAPSSPPGLHGMTMDRAAVCLRQAPTTNL